MDRFPKTLLLADINSPEIASGVAGLPTGTIYVPEEVVLRRASTLGMPAVHGW